VITGRRTPLTSTTSPSRPRILVIIDASSTAAVDPTRGLVSTITRSVAPASTGSVSRSSRTTIAPARPPDT
jgi:hypothetical protein